jgi:hypothetical protein
MGSLPDPAPQRGGAAEPGGDQEERGGEANGGDGKVGRAGMEGRGPERAGHGHEGEELTRA